MPLERLQKIISSRGIASRRKSEQMILDGRVSVNGKKVTKLGTKADPEKDHIKVDGKVIARSGSRRAYLLFKPRGVITTLSDPEGRPCLGDILRKFSVRVYHVGRLDANTEGLVLLTNDGDLANRVMHPVYGCLKVYEVKVRGIPQPSSLKKLEAGIVLDGRKTAPCVLELIREGNNAWFRLELREGRTHQIRKMFERIGHPVSKIKRVRIGPLTSRGLAPGQFRELRATEINLLLKATLGQRGNAHPGIGREGKHKG